MESNLGQSLAFRFSWVSIPACLWPIIFKYSSACLIRLDSTFFFLQTIFRSKMNSSSDKLVGIPANGIIWSISDGMKDNFFKQKRPKYFTVGPVWHDLYQNVHGGRHISARVRFVFHSWRLVDYHGGSLDQKCPPLDVGGCAPSGPKYVLQSLDGQAQPPPLWLERCEVHHFMAANLFVKDTEKACRRRGEEKTVFYKSWV